METQKIVNLLNASDNENSKFATKKWYVIDSEANGNYLLNNEIKFLTSLLESSLCDYSDAYFLVTGNINVTDGDENTKVGFKNCAPFEKCRTGINETFADDARHINIAMPMYNLIEYSDKCSDKSSSLWQFKRDEIQGDADLTVDAQHIPNVKLLKLLSEGFKRSVYWNKYQVILKDHAENENIRERLDASFPGVNQLFVFAYARGNNITYENSYRIYFLPRFKIKNYNIKIDGRNFYDQSINDLIKKYDKIKKISTGEDDDYKTGCLLNFAYFEKNYRLIAADLSKQKALDADPKAIQQIIFTSKTDNQIRVYHILEQSKETK